MKKTLISVAVAGAMAFSAVASAKAIVFGSVEQSFRMTDNGTTSSWDGVNDFNGNWIAFKGKEDLGNGVTAEAMIQFHTIPEGSNNGISVYDTRVGLKGGFGEVQMGRFRTPSMILGDKYVDIYEGGISGVDLQNNARTSNAIQYSTPDMSGIKGTVVVTMDGSSGETGADQTEYVLEYGNGPINAAVVYKDDAANNKETTSYMASGKVGAATIYGMMETHDNAGIETDAFSVAGKFTAGKNDIIAGLYDRDNNYDVKSVEVRHNFSKKTFGFATYQVKSPDSGAADTKAFTVGMRMKF